jgi:hypothetical protein
MRPGSLSGAPQPGVLQSPDYQTLQRRIGPDPEVHPLGFSEQPGKTLREFVAPIGRIGTEHLSSLLRPEPISAPKFLLRTPGSNEEYEVAVLTAGPKHSHSPGLRHAGEIEEIRVRPVSAPRSIRSGAQHQNRTGQIRQNALTPCGEKVG